jgi:ABC-type glutathione transport system ATPase component
VHGLGCTVNSRVLLAEVELVIDDEPLALLGPSGAGKSLALRCLLGLAPTEAQVVGELVMKDGRCVRLEDRKGLARLRGRGLTLLPQAAAASLDPVRRVEAQLREVLRVHANRDDTPTSLMALVGLEVGLLRRHPHALSGGQAQRVALALALGCRPAVLLADEPTAALDNLAQAQLLAALRSTCAARGAALVLVTHDLALAAGVCSRAVVLADGRMVEAGPIANLVAAPVHPTTRALVAAARRADALWQAPVPGDMP